LRGVGNRVRFPFALWAVLLSTAGCPAGCGQRPALSPRRASPALSPPSPREPFLYLYGCDPYFDRVDMTASQAAGTWALDKLVPDLVLPVSHTDGCAIHSPVFEPLSGRMFVAAPQTSSENAAGQRFDSIVGFQLPSFQVTDVIGANWSLEDPVSILVTDDSRLLASNFREDAWPGVGNGYIISTDISRPGQARRLDKTDGVSFSLDARYKDGIIWDGIRAVQFQNGRPTQQTIDLDELWARPLGAPLLPFVTPISPVVDKPFVVNWFLGGYNNRVLFILEGVRATPMTFVLGTIAPLSVRVITFKVSGPAYPYLIAEGHRILIIERSNGEDTGRLITIDADTGAVRKDWHVGELQLPPVYYLCAKDDLLLFGSGKSLLLVREGSSKVTTVRVPREIDTYARCLFATR